MKTVLVTGATGLIGACVCEKLIKQGDKVRAIVRKPEAPDGIALRDLGVEVIAGDIADLDCVMAATRGVDGVIHSAALRGIPAATIANSVPVNVIGTINVLTAAHMLGGQPVVQLLTSTFFDMWGQPQSEVTPLDLQFRNRDPYSVTKRLAYLEGFARVDAGQDIRFMLPGAGFGPSVCLENAMFHPNFNDRLALAIKGELAPQMPMTAPFVLASDCAYVCVAALEKGVKGERYIAMGRQQDTQTIAAVCNQACEIAGVSHRIEEVPKSRLSDPDIIEKYGSTMPSLARQTNPVPFFDSHRTEARLGYAPTPLRDGLVQTIDWMRSKGFI